MAFASITYTSASGTTFALTNSDGNAIEYLRQSDISVTVNGTLQTLTTDYTFNSAGTSIVLNSAVSNATVVIARTTSITDATVSFTAGSTLTAQDLNNSDRQNRFALQEFSDTYGGLTTGTGDLSALAGFIGENETWVSDDAHAATTGGIDSRIDTALTTDISGGDGVTIVDDSPAAGQIRIDLDPDIATLRNMQSGAATALAALTSTELGILDGATVTTAELNLLDGVTATTAELNTLDGVTATAAEINLLDGVTASTAELNLLDGVTATTAEINTLDGITANTTELNQLDGITVSTSFSNSATQIATSSAINSFVTNLLDALGGFVAIADDQSFPTTNPDPSDNAGTVVSIADAGGLVIDASGETTTGRTTGGATVTITGFPAVYQSSTLPAGLGIQVQTTTTLNTYTYHKSLPTDADIAQLNDDVNDFFARYRIGATNPTTDLDEGDLFYNTTDDQLLIWDGSAWSQAYVRTAIENVVEDTTPQLGGNLDVNGNQITSASNGNVVINPNGTGTIDLQAETDLNSNKLVNVTDPTAAQDGATKNYVDTTTTANPIYAAVAGDNFTGTISATERTITASDFDLSTGNYWTCGAIAIPNPTNQTAGTAGLIRVTAAPTSFGSHFDFPGGSYTAPTAFPAVVPFFVQASGTILLGNFVEGIA